MNPASLVAYYDRDRLFLGALLAPVFAFLFGYISILPDHPMWLKVLCTVLTLLFLACVPALLVQLWHREAMLIIHTDGILDRRFANKKIPWSVVQRISEFGFDNKRSYLVELSQPVQDFAQGRYKRFKVWVNRPFIRNGISVDANGLTVTYIEIEDAMKRFYRGPMQFDSRG
ncbi:MAG TPA: STM3941 family protein [Rhizomicrobium sp.]|jgi:hypothetical protein|nr:STM3941 family protein [Rhizomicrobium sp.]